MKSSNKTSVLVFVPIDADAGNFQERLRECIAAFSEMQQEAPAEPHEEAKSDDQEMPFWTWFLPNPLPKAKCDL